MSNSFLYNAIGIRGYQYISNRYEFGEVIFRIVKRQQDFLCSVFGSLIVICKRTGRYDQQCTHRFQTGAIVLAVQRVIYLVCDSLRKIQLGVADPNRPS